MYSRIILCALACCISLLVNAQLPAPPKPPAPPKIPKAPGFPWPWKKDKPSAYVKPVPKVLPVTYFVTDTAMIAASVLNTGDTNYYFKHPPKADTFFVYYDESKTQLAFRKIMVGGFRYNQESWYRNGQLKKTETNVEALPWNLHNTEEWYDNGNRKSSLAYTGDSCIYLSWWPDGKIAVEKRVQGNAASREQRWSGREDHWEKDCTLSESVIYSNDSALHYSYYYNGKLSRVSVTYPDSTAEGGAREHYRVSYYANGRPMHSPLYPDAGKQEITYYYLSGRVKAKGGWENGNDGAYRDYYNKKSHKVQSEGAYTASNTALPHTRHVNYFIIKSGHWTYYDEAGKKSKEEWYHPDFTMEFIIYDNTGKEKSKGKEEVTPTQILL